MVTADNNPNLLSNSNLNLNELRERVAEVVDLEHAAEVLGWDQETMMPPKGATSRATQLAALSGVIHERLTHPRVGELLAALEEPGAQSKLSETDQAMVRVLRRDYDRATKLPPALVRELARTTAEGVETWRAARAANDWAAFAPTLQRIFELKRQEAAAIGYTGEPYDALLDEFEPGMTASQLVPLFSDLRAASIDLLGRIEGAPRQLSRAALEQPWDTAKQLAFSEEILRQIGFDFQAGRQDLSTHPFTTGFGPTDVRVTTRVDQNDLQVALYASIHEGGHALYDQGVPIALARTNLGSGASLGIHESQSRLWENFIGRSLPFWQFALPRLAEHFPAQARGLTPEVMTEAVNRVERSLIRVEADEVTYNLHIILRFELERRLLRDELKVADLPAVWNDTMREYLGVVPPTNSLGVLQDTHWASGLIGYFPTYSLGNLYAAQLWNALRREYPDLEERLAGGEFAIVLGWLRDRVHSVGRALLPNQILERATGERPNPTYLATYLNEKYGRLYGLN